MVDKQKKFENETAVKNNTGYDEKVNIPDILTSKQEVADELKMSIYQFSQLLRRYPFESGAQVAGKIMGRWRVTKDDAWRWHRYVQRQEARHPDARRMRPEEPPILTELSGR